MAILSMSACSNNDTYIQSPPGEQSEAQTGPDESPVKAFAGVSVEMLSPEYWISEEDYSKTLFSSEEIFYFNENNPSYVSGEANNNGSQRKLFMHDLPDYLSSGDIRCMSGLEEIERMSQNSSSTSSPYYLDHEILTDDFWQTLIDNMALDSIPERVSPSYAVCTDRVIAYLAPCDDFVTTDPDEIYFNSMAVSEVAPMSGIVAVHESADGKWTLAICGSFCGWIRTECVALCHDQNEWYSACHPDNFLVVTGYQIIMDETARPTHSAGKRFPMGTILRLVNDIPSSINGRSTTGCYCVELPYRDTNGFLSWEQALIPATEDVHMGYPAMTSAAVIEQAFKMQGHVYGSAGLLSSSDCSGIIRQIYSCFGFDLPRNSNGIAKLSDLGSFDCAAMTSEKKKSILSKCPPGIILYMDGHLMLYLGSTDRLPYVISSCATCIEPDNETDEITDVYSVFVSGLDLKRSDGKTWLESLKYILWKEY